MRPTGAASGPESEGPGLGARFTFTIPVVEEAATRSAARSRRAPLTARAPAAGRCPPFEKQAGGSSGCPQVLDGDADQILRFRLVRRDDIERPEGVRRDAGSRGRVEDDADVAVPGGQSPGVNPAGRCT